MKQIIFTLVLCFPLLMSAADIPKVEQGAEVYDEKMCVERYANECISTVCLTSEARDCQQKCYEGARDKCREKLGSF